MDLSAQAVLADPLAQLVLGVLAGLSDPLGPEGQLDLLALVGLEGLVDPVDRSVPQGPSLQEVRLALSGLVVPEDP